jgi:integrase
VRETKNHTDHTLPFTKRVREILVERKRVAGEQEQVFGTAEVQKALIRIKQATGLWATPHALRRTWATCADKAGLGAYAIKAALNHKTTGDVTGIHYAQIDTEDLRPLMQRVEDFILRHAERRIDNVVELHAGGGR